MFSHQIILWMSSASHTINYKFIKTKQNVETRTNNNSSRHSAPRSRERERNSSGSVMDTLWLKVRWKKKTATVIIHMLRISPFASFSSTELNINTQPSIECVYMRCPTFLWSTPKTNRCHFYIRPNFRLYK